MSANETELKLEASVTNAKNGQLVRAHASSIIYKKNFRMDFSLPSPAVIHPDMPFMAWVIIGSSTSFVLQYVQVHSLSGMGTKSRWQDLFAGVFTEVDNGLVGQH